VWLAKFLYTSCALDLSELINLENSMNQSNSNAIETPSENVVNRLVEIFDVEDFNGFLELINQVEDKTQLLDFIDGQVIDEQKDIELFSDSFDDPEFENFILDLIGVDGTNVSAEKNSSVSDRPGKISGTKWNDLNGDGVKNDNEPGLAGRTIYLDENENGQLDETETSTITDEDGNYLFEGLKSTKTYTVAEVPKDGELATFPSETNSSSVNKQNSDLEAAAYTGTPDDPLFADQWNLQNTGQTGGTPGADANVVPAWEKATGEGVTIAIVDDGLESDHPDLAGKYQAELSYDFVEDDPDPNPDLNSEIPSRHGTSVAGIAAASTDNNTGVAGVAPDADLAGVRVYDDSSSGGEVASDSRTAKALSYKNQEIDIYNNSWGDTTFEGLGPETQAALQNGVRDGRGGLGSIFVFSSGNDRTAQSNVNYDALKNSRYAITVAAIDDTDNLYYDSTPGSSILVSGYSENLDKSESGITTTDVTGENGFTDGDYNDGFDGTSAAAPQVSGVVALMLDANPNLTWRDVQHILVDTSAQNDPTDSSWTVNGAGNEVSYKYGFGAVDADAAVTAAQDWTTVDPEIVTSSEQINVDQAIPDNNGESASSTVGITEDVEIEWVEVVFDADHTQRGDLEVTLTSPDGTESILAETHRDVNDNYDSWTFTSNRHWDESSMGDWTLEVTDNTTGETGTWNSWQLNVYGTDPDADDASGAQKVTVNNGENVDNVDFGTQQAAASNENNENFNVVTGVSANDPLMGSNQSDRFMLSGEETYTVADFTLGEDILELPENVAFEQLEITQGQGENANDTVISFESEAIAILNDTNAEEITAYSFA
jgi:subtilisin-like proprotein convertase family protein